MLQAALAIGFVQLLVPIVIAIAAQRRWKTSWSLFGIGAAAFVLSKVVQIPLSSGLELALDGHTIAPPLRLAIFLVFAPLCEETARWVAFRAIATRATDPRDAFSYGIGHGGVELAIFSALAVVNLGAATSGMLTPEQAHVIARATDGPWWTLLAGPLERSVALVSHVAMSWLVWRAVQERAPRWLVASMAMHYVLNGAIVGAAVFVSPLASLGACLVIAPLPIVLLLVASRREAKRDVEADAPDASMAISCRGLGKTFGDTRAVGAIDLDVKRGELFALLGPNGAGKTTLVRMLAGLIAPSRGRASVMGHALGEDDDAIRSRIGVLTEAPGMYESLSAEVNLRLFGRLSGLEGEALDARIEHLLRRFDLWERRHDVVGSFSKGMRQKTSIARVLLASPPLLFLDEPTSGLDPSAADEVRALVRELKAEGHTIVLTTHRLAEAEELADRVGILRTDMLALDTVAALRKRLYGQRVRVRCLPTEAHPLESLREQLDAVLGAHEGVGELERLETRDAIELVVSLEAPDVEAPRLIAALVARGIAVRSVADVEESLEDVYLDIVGRSR
ncbi:MAG: YhfC family intramembrane metalloprotease [Deltaproteobacteria bacterium]|nr:YhfC family intramembrane metalloprotease [Deltaproteobacteria bacterium]